MLVAQFLLNDSTKALSRLSISRTLRRNIRRHFIGYLLDGSKIPRHLRSSTSDRRDAGFHGSNELSFSPFADARFMIRRDATRINLLPPGRRTARVCRRIAGGEDWAKRQSASCHPCCHPVFRACDSRSLESHRRCSGHVRSFPLPFQRMPVSRQHEKIANNRKRVDPIQQRSLSQA